MIGSLLFIDIETSDKLRKDLPLGDDAQPWAVQVAAELTTAHGLPIAHLSALVEPAGRPMSAEAQAVHGIDVQFAEAFGIRENAILVCFQNLAARADAIVSYGEFDRNVLISLLTRLETDLRKPAGTFISKVFRPGAIFINAMAPSAQLAAKATPRPEYDFTGQPKWPTLDEACAAVLGMKPRVGHHDAWADLRRLKQLFLALARRGHFDKQLSVGEVYSRRLSQATASARLARRAVQSAGVAT